MNFMAFELSNSDKLTLAEYVHITDYIQDVVYNDKTVKTLYPVIANFFKQFEEIQVKENKWSFEISMRR